MKKYILSCLCLLIILSTAIVLFNKIPQRIIISRLTESNVTCISAQTTKETPNQNEEDTFVII